jgi:hypothetical protein
VSNPSGVGGLPGRIADWWDRRKVTGLVGGLVVVGGTVAALLHGGPGPGTCDTTPLQHIYRPARLQVVEKCAHVTGTVIAWRHEHDGDYHVSMVMDDPGWVNAVNDRKQHGYTVVEFVPLEPRPAFRVGQRLELTGTKVLDKQHGGWIELHPVFSFKEQQPGAAMAPNLPQLAPPTEEGSNP